MTRTWKTTHEMLAQIAHEQVEIRERQEVILLALGLSVPNFGPAEHDPWDFDHDTEEVYT